MQDKELEIIQWIEGSKYPRRLGRAVQKGEKMYLNFDLLPLAVVGKYGTVEVQVQEKRARDDAPQAAPAAPGKEDDEIPF